MSGAQPTIELIADFDSGSADLHARIRQENGWNTMRGTSAPQVTGFTADAGSLNCQLDSLDRELDPNNLAGSYVTGGVSDLVPGVGVQLIATWNGTPYVVFTGKAADWPQEYDDAGIDQYVPLKVDDGIVDFAAANFPTQRPVEFSGARLAAIAAGFGWPGTTAIDHGKATIAKLVYGQISAWNHSQQVAQAEWGDLYCDPENVLVFRDRNRIATEARSTTPQAVWTDESNAYALGHMRYATARLASVAPYNDVTVTFDDKGNQRNAQDAGSIAAKWGLRHKDLTLPIHTATQAQSYVAWLVHLYKTPFQTFTVVTFKPGDNPDVLFPEVLSRKLSDLVTVKRTPKRGAGGTITRDCLIRGIAHSHQAGNWQQSTFWLQDASWVSGIALYDTAVFDTDVYWF